MINLLDVSIDFSPMPYFDDKNNEFVVVYLVNDSIVGVPYAI